ncbi:MAG: hypothetical protein ACRC41_16490 [Sarcina sp.]
MNAKIKYKFLNRYTLTIIFLFILAAILGNSHNELLNRISYAFDIIVFALILVYIGIKNHLKT